MKRAKVRLLKKEEITADVFLLTLSNPGMNVNPGQFVNVLCDEDTEYILRRPISVFYSDEEIFKLLVQVKGKATKSLAGREKGAIIDVVGPLGRNFDIKEDSVIVAGGMGVAPLNFLAWRLNKAKVLVAAKTKDLLFNFSIPKRHEVLLATDDGSQGFKGNAAELLKKELEKTKTNMIYACGPEEMMMAAGKVAEEHNVRLQLSLERFMACGTGVCLSCVREMKSGLKRVCKDGPVFDYDEL